LVDLLELERLEDRSLHVFFYSSER
jgi:hypothetical protein